MIGNHKIGTSHPPFIVAELSGNHNQSLDRALTLVELAKHAGVNAVKLQTYTPDTITLPIQTGEFLIRDQNSLWKNRSLYDLYAEAHLPWEWHKPIIERCKELDLIVFSTPFDESAIDFLEAFDPPCYKIASPEIVDLPLIRKAASTGKPLIISTGASTLIEIGDAVIAARESGCQHLLLLKCTAAYPADPKDANLLTIPHLAQCFDTPVGLSDHSLGLGVAIASIALGACFIEKHFTDNRNNGGVDSAFSLEPQEFQQLVIESKRAWKSLGKVNYALSNSEKVSHSHRPSLYFVESLPKGTVIESHHLRSVRPGKGLSPHVADQLIGLRLVKDVNPGTAVSWDFFKEIK